MAQSFWEPETAHEEQVEQGPQTGTTLALSADEFSALEERIRRAVELVKRERQARAEAEARAANAETALRERTELVDQLEKEARTLRAERDHVRQRVERLLQQLDALEI